MQRIELGDEVRDSVTGFKGIAIGRTLWLHGCDRIVIQPKVGKDGKLADTATFDEPQLEVVKRKKVAAGTSKTGGFDIKVEAKATPSRH